MMVSLNTKRYFNVIIGLSLKVIVQELQDPEKGSEIWVKNLNSIVKKMNKIINDWYEAKGCN